MRLIPYPTQTIILPTFLTLRNNDPSHHCWKSGLTMSTECRFFWIIKFTYMLPIIQSFTSISDMQNWTIILLEIWSTHERSCPPFCSVVPLIFLLQLMSQCSRFWNRNSIVCETNYRVARTISGLESDCKLRNSLWGVIYFLLLQSQLLIDCTCTSCTHGYYWGQICERLGLHLVNWYHLHKLYFGALSGHEVVPPGSWSNSRSLSDDS